MKITVSSLTLIGLFSISMVGTGEDQKPDAQTAAGWVKYDKNPVIGGTLGTCFDVTVLREGDKYRMWFSWRPKRSLALTESEDGLAWSKPAIVLGPNAKSGWEDDINRPVVLKKGDTYHVWYTGQTKGAQDKGKSSIGYATSPDGKTWNRESDKPVLSPEQAWEKDCVTACQVVKQGDWYVMFYIGFRDQHTAQIGLARSRDGISNWQRHAANPIIRRGEGKWDGDSCYKPFALFDGKRWLLWYNGRKGDVEQIGVAMHDGEDLGFGREKRSGAGVKPK